MNDQWHNLRAREMDVYRAVHAALEAGDLPAVRRALGEPDGFPNVVEPYLQQPLLLAAIDVAPLDTIRSLLDAGADPNVPSQDGYPALISAIDDTDRPDRVQLVRLLLDRGADVQQRGINNYTPLHLAAAHDDVEMIDLLLAAGADPAATTVIDDDLTPLEEARMLDKMQAAAALERRGSAGDRST